MAKRIDALAPGDEVTLRFRHGTEPATFVGRSGEGEARRATFRSVGTGDEPYEWDAYRYNGRWAYGTSADRLSVV